jgi:O-antigen ligase
MSNPPIITIDATFAAARSRSDRIALLDLALTVPLIVAAFIDGPREATLGGISLMGALAAGETAIVLIAIVLARRYPRRIVLAVLPWGAFLVWAAARTAAATVDVGAVQNGIVYLLFGGCVLLGGIVAGRSTMRAYAGLDAGMKWIDGVGLLLALGSCAMFGLPYYGNEWLVGPRSVSLLGLIAISWHLARWVEEVPHALIRAAAWFLAILVSLSRTATAVALVQVLVILAIHGWYAPRRLLRRSGAMAMAGAAIAIVIALNVSKIGDRFLNAEFNVVEVGGVSISTSGRSNVWPAIMRSAEERAFIGHGLGSSQNVTVELWQSVGHPHNDYLRVWHDLGIVGLVLFVATTVGWVRFCFGDAWTAFGRGDTSEQRILPLAAFLALLGVLLTAFTDNAVIYAFVMAPVGILVGAGLGARKH